MSLSDMNTGYHIRYAQRQEIDTEKWDQCIGTAANGLIYAQAYYLDHMARKWDALILGDYEAVMPLTWNRKFGFYYLYQPFYASALGVFGSRPQDIPVSAFLRAIPAKFKYWDIDLNETNLTRDTFNGSVSSGLPLKTKMRLNHFLRLDKTHEEIAKDYKRLAKRMCKKALNDQMEIIRNVNPGEVIDLYRKEYGNRHRKVTVRIYEQFASCAAIAFAKGNAKTYLSKSADGEIAAFYLVLSDKKFVYSVMGGSTLRGKESGAFYQLTDAAIKDHAETERIFRFEGSDIPGIALFDASFGAAPVNYPHLVMNNLPFPVSLLK